MPVIWEIPANTISARTTEYESDSHNQVQAFDRRIIRREFCYSLEVLPYLEKHDLKPEWRIFSREYGTPPAFNIFPDVLKMNYEPDKYAGVSGVLPFERLKAEVGHPAYNFQSDFTLAKRLFTKYFQFPYQIVDAVETFFSFYEEQRILGLHYRGTDKVVDTFQTNPLTPELLSQPSHKG